MTFKIHYTIDNTDDSYTVSGDTIEDIMIANDKEMKKRNLDMDKNNCWSEEVT